MIKKIIAGCNATQQKGTGVFVGNVKNEWNKAKQWFWNTDVRKLINDISVFSKNGGWKDYFNTIGNWFAYNVDDILMWLGAIVGTIGVVSLFIPGGQIVGAVMTIIGYGLTMAQIIRRYS